jgi:hypothetical protein
MVLILLVATGQDTRNYQIAENNVVVRFGDKSLEMEAQSVASLASRNLQQLAEKYHLSPVAQIEIQMSFTITEFCQLTGSPWWQGSIYQNRIIHLQPVRILRERGILETTLRHELVHRLVDDQTKGHCPIWLSEVLAIYNSGEITVLKPVKKRVKRDELRWKELERRLQSAPSKEEAERLYFQLYLLGQFLERNFHPHQITKIILLLGAGRAFDQAAREILNASAKEIEQSWLREANLLFNR